MTKKRESLISQMNLLPRLALLLRSNHREPREIARMMNEDPEISNRLREMGKRIKPLDVRWGKEELEARVSIDSIVAKDDKAKSIVAEVQGRMEIVLGQIDDATEIFVKVKQIVNTKLDAAIEDSTLGVPDKAINTMLSVIRTYDSIVKGMKEDDEIRRFVNQGSMNINHGVTEERLFDCLVGVAKTLGHTEQEALTAFAEFRRSEKETPIEAEFRVKPDASSPS